MKKHIIFLFVFFCSIFISNAQNFKTLVDQLGSELQVVENIQVQVAQTIQEVQPGVVNIKQISTKIKDGTSTEEEFIFNLSDIDINTIRTTTIKDVIYVQLLVTRKQKMVQNITNKQKTSYVDAVQVLAKNIDNGRSLVDLFKKMVPVAVEITEKRLSLKTYEDHLQWLVKNVMEVGQAEKKITQKLSTTSGIVGRVELVQEEITDKKTIQKGFYFNLANIHANSILLETKGELAFLTVETRRKLKTIKTTTSGETGNYVAEFVLYCESIEKARDLQKVLKEVIPLAEKKVEESIPKVTTFSKGLLLLNDYIKLIESKESAVHQNFDGNCLSQFKRKEVAVSKTIEELFDFNWSDLQKNNIKFGTKGKQVFIEIGTKSGDKYIKQTLNGEPKSYTDKIELLFNEVEDAQKTEAILFQMIEFCEKEELKIPNTNAEILKQLAQKIQKVVLGKTTYDQYFSVIDDKTLQIKLVDVTDKTSKEKVFEFNIHDINPVSVQFNTSGLNVLVQIKTNYLEKIIKYYEDGAIKNYQNAITLQATDIENARQLVALFKKLATKK